MDYSPRTMRVRIRRDIGREVRPEAEQTDGNVYRFTPGWTMGEDDPYPGEIAMIPEDPAYPPDAPHWVASGDLEAMKKRWVVSFLLPAGGGGGIELAADAEEQAIAAVRDLHPNAVEISAQPSPSLFGGGGGGKG